MPNVNTPTPGDLSTRHVEVLREVVRAAKAAQSRLNGLMSGKLADLSHDEFIALQSALTHADAAIAALSALPAAGGSKVCPKCMGRGKRDIAHGETTDCAPCKGTGIVSTTPQPSAAEGAEGLLLCAEHGPWYAKGCAACAHDLDTMPGPDAAVGAQGDDGPDTFDCEHAHAARMCGCGFCRSLNLAAPAAGKGVEAYARELLAVEYERGELFEVATAIRRGNIPAGWKDDCIALRAISAALTRQPVAGDGMVLVGWASRKQIDRLRTESDLTGIMVHDEKTDTINVPMFAAPAATPTDGGEG